MRRHSFAAALLLAAVACESPPAAPDDAGPSFSASQVTKVTGGGSYDLSGAGLGLASFNYGVTGFPDGTASGNFHLEFEAGGEIIDFDGSATCLSVDPVTGRGWVGGVVTANRSTHPSFTQAIHAVGRDVWFRVVDYGEGSKAPNDRSTTFGFEGAAGIITSAEYCAARLWPASDARTWPVVRGNIQVR